MFVVIVFVVLQKMCWYKISILKKGYQKRLILRATNEKGFHVSILFPSASQITQWNKQKKGGKKKTIKATAVQKNEVLDCLDIVESNFVSQMNYAC